MSPVLYRTQAYSDQSRSFCALYALGVVPTALRKARLKFACDENPVAYAMSTSSRSLVRSSRLARSRRARLTYSCGAVPVAALKLREKCAGLMHATDASSLTVKARSTEALMNSVTRVRRFKSSGLSAPLNRFGQTAVAE